MIKISELKEGDILRVIDAGIEREGVVTDVDRDENKVCIDTGIQEFWFAPEEIAPIPLTEDHLVNLLGFEKETVSDGVKYKKGPFRVVIHDPGNNSNLEVWYREDRRHFNHPLYIHQLQNHHLDMTKMHLERAGAH
jgi:hypothetical protein